MLFLGLRRTQRCTRLHARYSTRPTQTPPPRRPFDILFFGRDEFSCLVLQQLYAAQDVWQQMWIATQPDMKTGRRGSVLSVSPLKTLGQELDIPVHTIPPDRPSFRHWQVPSPPHPFTPSSDPPPPERLLLTASFGRILPNSLLELFSPGRRLNVHPSLLPMYRGAAPIQYTIMDGQQETGVCVIEMMQMKKGIDAGEIWGQRRMAVPDGVEFPTLRDTLAVEGGQLLVSVLRDILRSKAVSIPQAIEPDAPRAPLITADDSCVDFATMPAEVVVRRHRAISHQVCSSLDMKPLFAYLRTGRTLQLHDPFVESAPSEGAKSLLINPGMMVYEPTTKALVIRCADDTCIRVGQVKQQDRALLSAKQWWNGVRPEMVVSVGGGEKVVLLSSQP
ncbi:hypothetical protein PHLGIDRAFT_512578 [Phlebiopsis gigantea 11061_1 CR5-6]|uniref:methionyl-tRNA formyltransferase n=1 Tax=Phlebiopsis gigantea (strain 11061_1 CR5-6) TaxID=745531 RepID=A0A0C3S8B8_PHLG1|nr:hypothetical protein PHLGIDRAFT_512578 [Phlebiopsis gigantea 11061_1 CR5-6]